MAMGLLENPESVTKRADRLTETCLYYTKESLNHLIYGNVDDYIESLRHALASALTLRKHLTGV